MPISRGQEPRQLYRGGGIMNLAPRQQYGLGSLVKSVKNAVSGAAKGVKSFVKSDIGKMALLAAGGFYAGGGSLFGLQRANMAGFGMQNLPGIGGLFTGGGSPGMKKGFLSNLVNLLLPLKRCLTPVVTFLPLLQGQLF